MSPAPSFFLMLNFALVTAIPAQEHRGTIGRAEKVVFRDAQDGLSQMGYTLDQVDSAAGAIIAERAIGTDPSVGTLYAELDIQVKAEGADSAVIEIHTVTWRKFIQESSRHRERNPVRAVEFDAERLLEALR